MKPKGDHEYPDKNDFVEYEDEDEPARVIPEIPDPVDAKGNPICQQPLYDQIIRMEVSMPLEGALVPAKVIGRTIGPDGTTSGTYNDDPTLNTMTYDVEFPDGQVKEYSANVIAEYMLSQVDHEGYTVFHLKEIIGHFRDEEAAINDDKGRVVLKDGQTRNRHTTAGWLLHVKWKTGDTQWIPLKDMKESYPVETAVYAKSRGIHTAPEFVWWVPYTLRKCDVIVSAVKTRMRRVTHKYGIELPHVKYGESAARKAFELDQKNGDSHWRDAIALEMHNVGLAFEILSDGTVTPVGWSKATGHLVFDVKITGQRKARWVLDGHKMPDPIHSTYAGVVWRENVRIALTYAALNNVGVTAADIRNVYLQAPSSEKFYIICGEEFGIKNVGKRALIRRALYGGKSAGRDFCNHLRDCMSHLHFTSCPADPDVWMRPAKKDDGSEYYECILLYTDAVLCISENGEHVLRNEIGKYFELKESSIGEPEFYLGGRLCKVTLENGVKAWAFGSSKYIQAVVSNVEKYLEKKGMKLPNKANTPTSTTYRPEIDVS